MTGDRDATGDEVLAMVLYCGMHLDRDLADEAAHRVAAMWGRPVHVVAVPLLGGQPGWALMDSDPDAGPEIEVPS